MIVANSIYLQVNNAKKWNTSFVRYFPEIGRQWVDLRIHHFSILRKITQDVRRRTFAHTLYFGGSPFVTLLQIIL